MKLINRTTRFYIIMFLVIFGIWSLVFFGVLTYNIHQNVDENLLRKKEVIVDEFIENELHIDNYVFEYSDFIIKPIGKADYKANFAKFTDTIVYEKVGEESQEYRKLETYFEHQGKYFLITIIKPLFETYDVIKTIAIVLVSLYFFIIIALVVSSRIMTRRIWKPFYKTIESIKKYHLDKHQPLQTVESKIDEFQELNQSLTALTENNYKTYISQKQFIENASHEMQTPLAVILSKCELVYQHAKLPEETALEVEKIHDAANRLSKMNQSLLLLSKIENNQFSEKTQEEVSQHIERILEFFDDIKEKKNIQLTLNVQRLTTISANAVLLEIMLTNLIKNAFVHNRQNGTIEIRLTSDRFEISNSRSPQRIEEDRLFSRFGKQSDNKDGLGLGLSIVKKICEIHDWQIDFSLDNDNISFTVVF